MYLKRTLHLVAIWAIAAGVSGVSFYLIWGNWPDGGRYLWQVATALLSLPTAFLHTVVFFQNIVVSAAGAVFLVFVVVYWIIMVRLQSAYIRKGRRLHLGIFVAILLISAIRWMYYADGLVGI